MGLVDWLRGRRRTPTESSAERAEARRQEQGDEDLPETPQDFEETAQQRRDEEASRHSGI